MGLPTTQGPCQQIRIRGSNPGYRLLPINSNCSLHLRIAFCGLKLKHPCFGFLPKGEFIGRGWGGGDVEQTQFCSCGCAALFGANKRARSASLTRKRTIGHRDRGSGARPGPVPGAHPTGTIPPRNPGSRSPQAPGHGARGPRGSPPCSPAGLGPLRPPTPGPTAPPGPGQAASRPP